MLSEPSDFQRIKATMMKAVRLSERPPAFVFEPNYGAVAFIEFDLGLTTKFWRLIRSLALATNDHYVFVIALEPDAEQYFYKEFGEYGVLQLAIDDTAERYVEGLAEHPDGWPVDSLKYNSEYLAWTSDSARWIAWGSRGFSFIAIGFEKQFSPPLNDLAREAGIAIFTKETAISNLILPSFQDTAAGQAFIREFRGNY